VVLLSFHQPFVELLDLFDCQVTLFGGDSQIGALSDGQFVHYKAQRLPQRAEVPLVRRRVVAGLWNLIGRDPHHVGRKIEVDHEFWSPETIS
jgi:hypothetical protein